MKKGDRGNLYALDQELDSLQVNQHQVLNLVLNFKLVSSVTPAENVFRTDSAASGAPADHGGDV